ncbi:MAG: hypothetical protein AAGA92_06070 [Planctomycetota bacterium]
MIQQVLALVVFVGLVIGGLVLAVWSIMTMGGDGNRSGTATSALAGAMIEVDKIVRPSHEHVVEAQEEALRKADGDNDGE